MQEISSNSPRELSDQSTSHQISIKLQQKLSDQILAAGGWISFAEFMASVLYTPDIGYYCRADKDIFGKKGDFVTAPELSPLFAITLAKAIMDLWQQLPNNIIEYGGGSGQLALDLLLELQKQNSLPEKYFIIEISPALRKRQQNLLNKYQQFAEIVVWLDEIPQNFNGVIIANEVIDAMPVHLINWQEEQIYERGVGLTSSHNSNNENNNSIKHSINNQQSELNTNFILVDRLATDQLLLVAKNIAEENNISPPYQSEINLELIKWLSNIAEKCNLVSVIIFDYGFPAGEYYHPQRDQGTLISHHQQMSYHDPLYKIGDCDLTAHVDFTCLVSNAYQLGFKLCVYCSQAQFLLAYEILPTLAEKYPIASAEYIKETQAINQLISPAEMGELFKVMILNKNIDIPLNKLENHDRRFSL